MHFHHKSAQFTNLNGLRLLLILLAAHATYVQSDLTPEEIQEAINEVAPVKYCGKRLNVAMRTFCSPIMKTLIMAQARGGMQKKSCKANPFIDTMTGDFTKILFFFQWNLRVRLIVILTSRVLTLIEWLWRITKRWNQFGPALDLTTLTMQMISHSCLRNNRQTEDVDVELSRSVVRMLVLKLI